MKNQWLVSTNNYHLRETSIIEPKLEKGVYKTVETLSEVYLQKISDNFDMPAKIYGFEKDFIQRLHKTYAALEGNLGVLFNGIKGTGKTVTAKMFCNEIDLPIIIVSGAHVKLPDFINNIQQEVVVFFDEYEKIYKEYDHSILTVMDGVLDNGFKRIFLLTTNTLHINENLLQRPGRIRYHKTYGDLDLSCINEIVDDLLENKVRRDIVVQFISELEIITVDIVKAIINEINIHDEDPYVFASFFNVKRNEEAYNVYHIFEKEGNKVESLTFPRAKITNVDDLNTGKPFTINNRNLGTILIKAGDMLIVEDTKDNEKVRFQYRLEKYYIVHRSFFKS